VPDQQITIRTREAADLDACVRALADVHHGSGYPTNWPADPARWLTPPGILHAWIATSSECPVAGQVILVQAADGAGGEPAAEVSRLFVVPAARRSGVAQALLRQAIDWSAASDLDLTLEVTDHLRAARALYERTGFRLVRTYQAEWTAPDGQPVTLHTYRRGREISTPAG
jgi:GNAT superfamily N-acetyltransferase